MAVPMDVMDVIHRTSHLWMSSIEPAMNLWGYMAGSMDVLDVQESELRSVLALESQVNGLKGHLAHKKLHPHRTTVGY